MVSSEIRVLPAINFDHPRRLAVDLKAKTGFDYRLSITQVEQDIAAIEAGLNTLSGPAS